MNFQALEWLIQSIISQYSCDNCSIKLDKKDVSIKQIEWTSVVLELTCPKCNFKWLIKSEVVSLDLTKYLSEKELKEIQNSIEWVRNKNSIKDEQIVELNRDLKKENLEVWDLFN